MTIQTNLTGDDWRAFLRFTQRRLMGGAAAKLRLCLALLGFAVVFGLLVNVSKSKIDAGSMIVGALVTVLWLAIIIRLQARRMRPATDGIMIGPHSITLDDDGVRDRARLRESLVRWEAVRAVQVTAAHVFIVVDNHAAFIIPRRSFSSDTEREQFVSEIQKRSGKVAA